MDDLGADKFQLKAIYDHALSLAKISRVVENISGVRYYSTFLVRVFWFATFSPVRCCIALLRCMSRSTTATSILASTCCWAWANLSVRETSKPWLRPDASSKSGLETPAIGSSNW